MKRATQKLTEVVLKKIIIGFVFLVVLGGMTGPAFAEEQATRAEVIEMCKSAAELVLTDKAAAIAEIGAKNGKFVWKNSYVFLMNMDGRMLAHPMMPQLTEKEALLDVTDKNQAKPKKIFVEFVDIAEKNGEGWLWYVWPKPAGEIPEDKFTYIYRVGYTDMFVGAGIYK
jgi:signal transduction histidine kinase